MTVEQKNSLLGYISNRLERQKYDLSPEIISLLVSYSLLQNSHRNGLIDVEPYVKMSLQLIEGFKKIPLTKSIITEYEQLNA